MERINCYKRQFTARCSNNDAMIIYTMTLETSETIMVERINEELDAITTGFHEDIADALHSKFGGKMIIEAHHHGVDIRTVRQ